MHSLVKCLGFFLPQGHCKSFCFFQEYTCPTLVFFYLDKLARDSAADACNAQVLTELTESTFI